MKRGKKMLLLLLALVLCAGGYYGAQLLNQDPASVSEESGAYALESRVTDDLSSLSWSEGDTTLSFIRKDGVWTVSGDAAFPLNQDDMQDMADKLLALTGNRKLEGVTDLSIYGLDEPAFSVTAAWTDGTATTWTLGDETPFDDGYYLSTGTDGVVYTIEDDLSDIFDVTLNELAVMEALPSADNVTRITVGTTLDAEKTEASRTINAGELWYDHVTGAALDASAMDDLLSAAQSLAWSELAEPTASDEELSSYSVDEASATAITLYSGDVAALALLIGTQNEDGDYYARLPGSSMVYTVASDDLENLLNASAAAMPSMTIIDLAEENVLTATFSAGDYTYTWTTVTEEETEAIASATDADTAADAEAEDPGAILWASILALNADSCIDEVTGCILLNVEVTSTDGKSAVLSFSEYDAESYAVTVLDRCFLVDAAEVDAIIRSLRAIR